MRTAATVTCRSPVVDRRAPTAACSVADRRERAGGLRQPWHESAGDGGAGSSGAVAARTAARGGGAGGRRRRRGHGRRHGGAAGTAAGGTPAAAARRERRRGGAAGAGGGADQRRRRGAAADRRRAVDSGPCTAMFNFESGLPTGAMIDTGSQLAFQSIAARAAPTRFCGKARWRSRRCSAAPSGNSIKGEVLIPLPGAPRRSDQQDDHRPRRGRSRLQQRPQPRAGAEHAGRPRSFHADVPDPAAHRRVEDGMVTLPPTRARRRR